MHPIEVNGKADAPLQSLEDPTLEQVAPSEEGCDSEGSPCGSNLSFGELHPVKWTHAQTVHEEMQPVVRAHQENFMEDCLLWKGCHTGAREEYK